MKRIYTVLLVLLFTASAALAQIQADVDDNDDHDIEAGGTNASTAAGARANLDVYSTGEVDAGLAGKVGTTGDEVVGGIKNFTASPIVPTPTTDYQAATKAYADSVGGGAVTGTTYYVSSSGSDSNDGLTVDTTFLTVAHVNAMSLSPGDSVLFKRGDTWTERLVITSSGSSAGYITFGAYGAGEKPSFEVPAFAYFGGVIHGAIGTQYIIVENIQIVGDGANVANENIGVYFNQSNNIIVDSVDVSNMDSAGVNLLDSTYVEVKDCRIDYVCLQSGNESISIANVQYFSVHHNVISHGGWNGTPLGGSGVDAKKGSAYGEIYNNYIYGQLYAHSIYIDAASATTHHIAVYNNLLLDGAHAGISLNSEGGGLLEYIYVYNNVVAGHAHDGIVIQGDGPSNPMDHIYITNNTVVGNGSTGTWYGGIAVNNADVENAFIYNNIVTNNYGFQIGTNDDKPPIGPVTITHNLWYGDADISGTYSASNGTDVINADPQFIDASVDDYRLIAGSPAISNAGTATEIKPLVDVWGNPFAEYNRGAYAGTGETSASAETNSLETTVTGVANGEIFVGNGADSGTFVVPSGDATINNAGVITLGADVIGTAEMADADHGDVSWSGGVATVDQVTISDSDFLPIGWAEDGTTAPAAEASVTGSTRHIGRAFDGAANEDVTYIWKVPVDFSGSAVTVNVDNVVSAATAPANTEVVAYSVAISCYGNSELSTLAVGTSQTTSLTADATYAQYDQLTTSNSAAITPAGSISAGEICAIAVTRLAASTDTYAQDIDQLGINVNYTRVLQ